VAVVDVMVLLVQLQVQPTKVTKAVFLIPVAVIMALVVVVQVRLEVTVSAHRLLVKLEMVVVD
jgi:hypothetical protein